MWEAYLFQTINGQVGPRIPYESLSWSIDLNDIESINIKLKKSGLPNVDKRYWFSPWWAGVLLMYDGRPVVAGPITTRPYEDQLSLHINTGGIRSVLSARVIVPEMQNWATLNKQTIQYKGLSLGTIAKRVVQSVQQKAGGGLPISYAIADETVANDADHQRTYQSFNVHNLFCDDVLTKLSNVTDGPDIMFRPRMINDGRLTFDLWTGTETQPRIRQSYTQVWDTTAIEGNVTDMSIIETGTYQASRVYATGAGQDQGTLIEVRTDESTFGRGYPLLERTFNSGDSESKTVVGNHAMANLRANKSSLTEIQMTVRGDQEIPFGRFWPGDLCHVYVKDWVGLPDGLTQMRILSMTGDHTNNVKLSLQEESRY